MTEALEVLEPYRPYLMVLAEIHLTGPTADKVQTEDVVHQTLVRAAAAFDGLRERQASVVRAWLRKILARTLADAAKHWRRDRRDVTREQSLEGDLDRSSARLDEWLAADHTSPSGRAERNEAVLRLAAALGQLPEHYRSVIVQKHLHGRTLEQIAAATGRTVPAVVASLRRGLAQLRELLGERT